MSPDDLLTAVSNVQYIIRGYRVQLFGFARFSLVNNGDLSVSAAIGGVYIRDRK
jgi:hypothetical protein